MHQYFTQLREDIIYATANVTMPYAEQELGIHDWLSEEDEEKTAPVRELGGMDRHYKRNVAAR